MILCVARSRSHLRPHLTVCFSLVSVTSYTHSEAVSVVTSVLVEAAGAAEDTLSPASGAKCPSQTEGLVEL